MGNNEPTVDQSDFRIRGSYGLNTYIHCIPKKHHCTENAATNNYYNVLVLTHS